MTAGRTSHDWDPERYLRYADERGRPFVELLARVGAEDPRQVVDLGCGPGNLTQLLAQRWPSAHVVGLDSSPQMVERAREVDGIHAEVADIADWAGEPRRSGNPSVSGNPVDVLVSNAALQWQGVGRAGSAVLTDRTTRDTSCPRLYLSDMFGL